MRRPEGVGGGSTPPVRSPARPSPTSSAASSGSATPPKPARQSKPARDPRPISRRPESAATAPRPVAPPAESRTPASEVRAAVRARRREERREIHRFTRRTRRRRLGLATAIGLFVVLVALVTTAVFSPLLALRTIKVDGTQRLDAATLQAALEPQLGTPLALLDDDAIRRELGRFQLIRSYVTELQPPDTLVVHISERTPVGVIQGADDFQLVDPAGVVVDRSAKRPDGVPLIQLGSAPLDGPGYASMAQVLLALPAALRAQVDTIAALTHDDVTLTLRGSGQRVVWGSADQSALKAQVLARLIALHGQSGSGTYTVSAPEFAVFNPGAPPVDGGTSGGTTIPGGSSAQGGSGQGGGQTDQGGIQTGG